MVKFAKLRCIEARFRVGERTRSILCLKRRRSEVTFLSNVLKCDVLGFNLTPERLFNVTGEAQTMRLRASSLLLSGLGLVS